MGFDNECIVNIQSLAGEYFCPVCRLLVYPNEALQSQCTHLYCKPCLTYVVGTTRACPYDGYLVTEPDSKPLLESNKSLAETIGKIAVRCLYHRSGCQWQGPLSDSAMHCSGCAFGNSAVVCNRCAVQIVHRQVQEHAQTCPGVQPQATQPDATQNPAATVAAAPATMGQPQPATQSVPTNAVANPAQTGAPPVTGHDPNLQGNLNPQANNAATNAALTPEQLYQHQYYQQYPGYDPYQQTYQNYYPYPQQPQVYSQPQQVPQVPVQSQAPVQPQPPVQSQPQIIQNVNPYYQNQPPPQMMPQQAQYPYPQPPYQQPRPTQPQQMTQFPPQQPQMPPQQPQMPPQQPQQAQSHPYNQLQLQQLPQAVTGHQSYPQPQTQHRPNMHPHGQYPPPMGPTHPHPSAPHQQLPPQGLLPGAPPAHQRPPSIYTQQPGHSQPMQQFIPPQQNMPPQQNVTHQQIMAHQQAFSGQLPPPPTLHPSARPMMPYPGQPQHRPPQLGANQHFPGQNQQFKNNNQIQINETPTQRTQDPNAEAHKSEKDVNLGGNGEAKDTGSELHKSNIISEQKDEADGSKKGENLTTGDMSKEGRVDAEANKSEISANKLEENKIGQLNGQMLGNGSAQPSHQFPHPDQARGQNFPMQYPAMHQQRPSGPPMSQPGQPPHMLRTQGPDYIQHPPPFERQFGNYERNMETQNTGGPRMPSGMLNSSFPDPKDERFNLLTDRVSRAFDEEPFGLNSETGIKLESGALGPPRFLPHYYPGGANEAGNRVPQLGPIGNFPNARPDFHNHHMDRFASRSPGRGNPGFPPRNFGNFEGRDSRPFDGGPRPFGNFQRGGELDGPGFLRGNEFQAPRSLPGHLNLNDPTGFGAFPGPPRGENFPHDRPFMSSYPAPGGLDPFDNSRKRLPSNNGWCRICKVDCEGVEGLELHSQTREHQDMAMDMVRTIKLQNSKKQKMSGDRSSLEEPSKRRGIRR